MLIMKPVFAIDIYGPAWKLLSVKSENGHTDLYVKNYQNKNILLYRANFIYKDADGASADQEDDTLFVIFNCDNKNICERFFDRRANTLSNIYTDVIGTNGKNNKQIVANYDRKNNEIIVETLFTSCKKSTLYPLKIYPDSVFGDKTDFYPHGKLRIDYAAPTGNYATKIFHVNYVKVVERCRTGKG